MTIELQRLGPFPNFGRDIDGNVYSLPREVASHNGHSKYLRKIKGRRLTWRMQKGCKTTRVKLEESTFTRASIREMEIREDWQTYEMEK